MLANARRFLSEHTRSVQTVEELHTAVRAEKNFALAGWCGDDACEATIKEETGATSRNIPFDPPERLATCVNCGKTAAHTVWFGRSY